VRTNNDTGVTWGYTIDSADTALPNDYDGTQPGFSSTRVSSSLLDSLVAVKAKKIKRDKIKKEIGNRIATFSALRVENVSLE
jgi:hypothetical protein